MRRINIEQIYLSISVATLMFVTGCYSNETVNPNDYVEKKELTGKRIAGAKVFIELRNGERYYSELLFVRDSIMLYVVRLTQLKKSYLIRSIRLILSGIMR